jgi:hypothetical protein
MKHIRVLLLFLFLAGLGVACYYLYRSHMLLAAWAAWLVGFVFGVAWRNKLLIELRAAISRIENMVAATAAKVDGFTMDARRLARAAATKDLSEVASEVTAVGKKL